MNKRLQIYEPKPFFSLEERRESLYISDETIKKYLDLKKEQGDNYDGSKQRHGD